MAEKEGVKNLIPGSFGTACLHQCNCPCHSKGDIGVMHIMPCCMGRCELCNRSIKFGMMEAHLKTCHGKKD